MVSSKGFRENSGVIGRDGLNLTCPSVIGSIVEGTGGSVVCMPPREGVGEGIRGDCPPRGPWATRKGVPAHVTHASSSRLSMDRVELRELGGVEMTLGMMTDARKQKYYELRMPSPRIN